MKQNQLKAGAVLSYINLLIGNIIPFIYTPIMLRMLGQTEYGIYGIAQSIMGYLHLLNFGIGGSIVRYLSKYRAEDDKEGEARIFGLFIKIYAVIGAMILIAGMIFSVNLDFYGRSLSAEEMELLRQLIRLMTINSAFFLPFNVYGSVIIAHERFIFSKLIAMISGIIAPMLNLSLLFFGLGSVGLVVSSTILNFVTYIIYVYYVHRKMCFRPRFAKVGSGILKEIIGFSLFVFVANIVDILYWSTDKLIIGWAIGSAATAVYNIGATFNGYITGLSTAVSGVLMPKVTSMTVKDTPREELTELFIKVGRLQFIIISFIVSAFVAFGRQFIVLWAGEGYEQAYAVALLTMLPVTIPLIQNTGLNILYALNKHSFRSIAYACVAVLNVVFTFWWVESYGIIGAAMATCMAYTIGNVFVMNWYYYKKIGIDIPLFWKNILRMCPVMVVMGTSCWFILDVLPVTNWGIFFVLAVLYSVIYIILAYFLMMNSYEKSLFSSPIKKIRDWIIN